MGQHLLLAAGSGGGSALSTEGIYNNLIYEGTGGNRTVTTGVPIYAPSAPSISIPYTYAGAPGPSYLDTVSAQAGDHLIVFCQNLFNSNGTLTVNGNTVTAAARRSNYFGYHLAAWIYKFETGGSIPYQLTNLDPGSTHVMLVRGATNATVQTPFTDYPGSTFTTTSYASNGCGFLFASDRDPGRTATANNGTLLSALSVNDNFFSGRVWQINNVSGTVPATTVTWDGNTYNGDWIMVDFSNTDSSPGLLMISQRNNSSGTTFFIDTIRGRNSFLDSAGETIPILPNDITSWNATGFSLQPNGNINLSAQSYLVHAFKKEKGFFDIISWTGNGTNRTIPHELGATPGLIIVKGYGGPGPWPWTMHHRLMPPSRYLTLNQSETTDLTVWNNTAPTSTSISVGTSERTNNNGTLYVAYLFGHSDDGKYPIRCESFTGTNLASTAPFVDVGWEPQALWFRRADNAQGLGTYSNSQGFSTPWATARILFNGLQSDQNIQQGGIQTTATGFFPRDTIWQASSITTYYMAVRRPDTEPTSGSQVFNPVAYTANNTDGRKVDTTIDPDMVMLRVRGTTTAASSEFFFADRKSGSHFIGVGTAGQGFDSDSLMAPSLVGGIGSSFAAEKGFGVGNDVTRRFNYISDQIIAWCWKRGYKFFDTQVFTRTANAPTAQTIKHNLGVVPEMIWARRFAAAGANMDTVVYTNHSGATNFLSLRSTAIPSSATNYWGNTAPTDTEFTYSFGASGETHVAWLFASLPGISKLGTYVGNGGSLQTINCGFAAGARFVLIKAVSDLGDWWVFDTARGFSVSLKLNLTTAEQSAPSYVGSTSSGFTVSNVNVNANGITYYYYAIA